MTTNPSLTLPPDAIPPYWGMENKLPSRQVLDELLAKTKGRLFYFYGAGFIGSLLGQHNIVWDEKAETAWCDGETIGLNPWFFFALEKDERVTLLAHEVWHTGFDHMSRIMERDPGTWNQAADYVINNMMDSNGYKFTGLLQIGCLDHQYDNMTTEEVYDSLVQQGYVPPPGMVSLICPQQGQRSDDPGQGGNQGQDPSAPARGPLKPLSGDIRAAGPDKAIEIKKKIVQAAQISRMSKEAGVIPGETELIIDEFLSPVLPWEVLLARFFNEMSQDDYSMQRPNRRYEDEYLPSLMGNNGLEHLSFYLDVSGSVTDAQITRFNSEVKHIHDHFGPKRLTLITFDRKIQDVYEFTDNDVFEKIVVNGRGGTSLDPVRQHIKKHKPTAAVIFSDMHCYPMDPDPRVPILWAIMDNPKAKTTFGRQVHIRKDQI